MAKRRRFTSQFKAEVLLKHLLVKVPKQGRRHHLSQDHVVVETPTD